MQIPIAHLSENQLEMVEWVFWLHESPSPELTIFLDHYATYERQTKRHHWKRKEHTLYYNRLAGSREKSAQDTEVPMPDSVKEELKIEIASRIRIKLWSERFYP